MYFSQSNSEEADQTRSGRQILDKSSALDMIEQYEDDNFIQHGFKVSKMKSRVSREPYKKPKPLPVHRDVYVSAT